MPYVEVAVNFRSTPGKTFSYSVPDGMRALPGHVVEVPFGARHLPGFIFELTSAPSFSETKDVTRVIGHEPWLTEWQLRLARWLSITYFAPLYDAAALAVPPGFRQKVQATYQPSDAPSQMSLNSMDDQQGAVLEYIREAGHVAEPDVRRKFGQKRADIALGQLVRRRLLVKTWTWLTPTIRPKFSSQAELAIGAMQALAEAERLAGARSKKQAALLAALARAPDGFADVAPLLAQAAASSVTLKALERRGLVRISKRRVERDPLAGRRYLATRPLVMTPHQEHAWAEISAALRSGGTRGQVFLLQGVTGSGKTELYLNALQQVVREGGRGIVLVPEIALAPQTIERFSGRFPGRVAVLHSRLSAGQQFDEWWRIHNGEFDVVVGSRGAIFAPQPDLRLIVLDEEHEWTYKQQDPAPRYHARDVAVKLAELTGATVILGSATPQMESYYRACSGEYRLLELPERVGPTPGPTGEPVPLPMPQVRIVDMRDELKTGNRSVFSRPLQRAMESALGQHQQVILFLNRRGSSTFVQCRDCGHVVTCRRCSGTLTYHAEDASMRCHQCNYRMPPPTHCSECMSSRVRYVGLGTERLESEVQKAFPAARPIRWDSDVTQGADSHELILRTFLNREADVLVGTQMIAKGLHLPGVTLVGVVNADIGLYAPDPRAGERTFEILCQVAGRSGRGEEPGRVIIQTYSPGHYAIAAAARQDYVGFYEEELRIRAEGGMPPFNRLARLVYSSTNAAACQREAERVEGILRGRLAEWAYPNTRIIGPAPAPLERLRGRYRWHILIQAPDPAVMLDNMPLPEGWIVDIDPMTMS